MPLSKEILKVYNEIISEQEQEIIRLRAELAKANEEIKLYHKIATDSLKAYQQANDDLKQAVAMVKRLNYAVKGLKYANN